MKQGSPPHAKATRGNAPTTTGTGIRLQAKRSAGRVAAGSRREAKGSGRDATKTRVFVYGTLLTGEYNHRYIARAALVGEALTTPTFALYDLGAFPALVAGGTHAVAGEVYEVDEVTLAELDRLEGHPRFYRRTQIRLADGSLVLTYLMEPNQTQDCSLIESGNWRTRHAERADSSR